MSEVIEGSEGVEQVLFTASLSANVKIIEEKLDELGVKSKKEHKEDEVPDEIKKGIDQLWVGRPQVFSLLEMYDVTKIKLPADIKIMSKDYNFFQADLACGFIPQEGSQFANLKFKVDLDLINSSNSSKHAEKPIAYDIYPVEVFDKVQEKTSLCINPNLKFKEIEASLGSFLKEVTSAKLVPITVGAGIFCPSVVWSFDETKDCKLIGSRRMNLIIKAPKGNLTVVGTISVFGQIRRGFWSLFRRDPIEYTIDLGNGILIHPKTK